LIWFENPVDNEMIDQEIIVEGTDNAITGAGEPNPPAPTFPDLKGVILFLSSAPLLGVIVDSEGRVQYCNDHFLNASGWKLDELAGKSWLELLRPVNLKDRNAQSIPLDGGTAVLTSTGEAIAVHWKTVSIQLEVNKETITVYLGESSEGQARIEKALRDSEERFRTLVSSMEEVVFTLNLEGRYTGVFGRWAERLGMTPEFFLGHTFRDMMGEYAALPHEVAFRQAVFGHHVLYDWSSPTPTGVHHYQTSLSPMTSAGKVVGVVGVERDITAQQEVENEVQRLYEKEQRRAMELDALRATFSDLVSELELPVLLRAILQRAVLMLGATGGELALSEPESGDLVIATCLGSKTDRTGEHIRPAEGGIGKIATTRKPVYYEEELEPVEDDPFASETIGRGLGSPLSYGHEFLGAILVHVPIHAGEEPSTGLDLLNMFASQAAIAIRNARLFERMEELATTDALTGLNNRRYLFELGTYEVKRSRRYKNNLSLIMIDLDHFKKVNDTYGHLAGDQVLRVVGKCCLQTFRKIDLLGRYGGEEFVAVLPETGLREAVVAAERFRKALEDLRVVTPAGEVKVTASLGVAEMDPETGDLESLLNHADQALYEVKRDGRNQVKVYSAAISQD
jgi:diguanylate cyclase (GGDEF)-like protein/PAS domain S-box-containing protein